MTDFVVPLPTGVDGKELTSRGAATRQRLLDAAEDVFAEFGYHEASIVKITEAAHVAQGTFYLYFASKQEIFEELVRDLNRRVRHAMAAGAERGRTRAEAELFGFAGYFEFAAQHGALPDHPPGRVRFAGDAARTLPGDRLGLRRCSRVGDGSGRGGAHGS